MVSTPFSREESFFRLSNPPARQQQQAQQPHRFQQSTQATANDSTATLSIARNNLRRLSAQHEHFTALPAVFFLHEKGHMGIRRAVPITSDSTIEDYLKLELDVSRLNKIHKHLWCAGLPQPPRPLHHHFQLGRTVRITERADMHLLWASEVIYLKPFPSFLMCHQVWGDYLCKNPRLHASALVFLWSYICLIWHPSDHKLAKDIGLLADNISWETWVAFTAVLLESVDFNLQINPRYKFGELRLNRLNWLVGYCSNTRSLDTLIRGYSYSYHTYRDFLTKNLAFLVTGFLYAAIVLGAMSVGLATHHLNDSESFQRASWGFSVAAIVSPLAFTSLVLLYALFLIVRNYIFTRSKRGKPEPEDDCWSDIAIESFKH